MLEFTTNTQVAPVEREELFSLDGVIYTIPVKFFTVDALAFTDTLRKFGVDAASSWALEFALGTDGYRALMEASGQTISDEAFAVLLHIVTARLLGREAAVPGPKAPAATSTDTPDLPVPEEPDSPAWPTPTQRGTWPVTDTPLDPTTELSRGSNSPRVNPLGVPLED